MASTTVTGAHRIPDFDLATYIPEPRTLADLLRRAALHWPDSEVVFPDERVTYAALEPRAEALARHFLAAGMEPGDHVGLLLPAGLPMVTAMFAIAKIGGTVVPISERFKSAELRYVIEHSDITLLLTTGTTTGFHDFPTLLEDALPSLGRPAGGTLELPEAPRLRRILLVGEPEARPGFDRLEDVAEKAAAITSDTILSLQLRVRLSDNAFVMYTSGTSAQPKGCLTTHEAAAREAQALVHVPYKLQPSDRFWVPLPLFHNGAVCTLIACMTAGASYVHCGHFDADVALRQLEEERCTHSIPAFAAVWVPVLNHPRFDEADLSTLRFLCSSGTAEYLRKIQARTPHVTVASNYGSTEGAGSVAMATTGDSIEIRTETCGHTFPGMEFRIVDPDTGVQLGPNQPGALLMRGPHLFSGYYKDPELTASLFEPGGWFHTGDRGLLDENGFLVFLGRLKDMLKVGGENVSAAEVEAYLIMHPAIDVAQVVGAPDARYGEVPAAFVELAPGATLSEEELVEYCLGKIATFKVPR